MHPLHMIGSDGRDRGPGASGRSRKRGRGGREEIDPLDPTGKSGGKWSDGLVQVSSVQAGRPRQVAHSFVFAS